MLYRELKALSVTACQELIFVAAFSAVYRTDGMNHVLHLANFIGPGDLRMTRFASSQMPAFLQEIWASRMVNRSIDSATS